MATISTGLISRYQPVDIVAMVFPCLAVYHRVGAFEVMACHGINREYTECYSISFLFLFFFHQSSLYPIKIFAKCFYLLVCILFSAPTLSELKLIIIPIFREPSVYTNGHGFIIIGIIGSRLATLLHHSLVQLCCKFKACGL